MDSDAPDGLPELETQASSGASGGSVDRDEDGPPELETQAPSGEDGLPEFEKAPTARTFPSRRRLTSLGFLAFGAFVAWYLGSQGPREQHVRVVLGAAAPTITAVALQYLSPDGESARETRFAYPPGSAPRVVAHEPQLPDGEYRLQIDVDARDGRRAIQRQVTLGGGSTQIDISSALTRDETRLPPTPSASQDLPSPP